MNRQYKDLFYLLFIIHIKLLLSIEKKYVCKKCNFMLRLSENNLNNIIKQIILCANGGNREYLK